ncbi:hypothetical protein AMJ86_00810 [bacterium SM23_57]|nr:MAG: hypothetical protein AMJ86_00810 [bacterium SM23_57]
MRFLKNRQLSPCELTNGRLLADCKAGMSGVKTLFLTPYTNLTYTIDGVSGEIDDIGTVELFRFEMANGVGNYVENVISSDESGVAYVEQVLTLVEQHILQEDLADLNAMIKGRFIIFAMDYQNNIRCFGMYNGATATGGDSASGTAPADPKQANIIFTARENDFAPFCEAFTSEPFDNMAGVTITPAY